MIMQTSEGQQVAGMLSASLIALAELDKVSTLDAEQLWTMLANHLRSARPQALMSLEQVP